MSTLNIYYCLNFFYFFGFKKIALVFSHFQSNTIYTVTAYLRTISLFMFIHHLVIFLETLGDSPLEADYSQIYRHNIFTTTPYHILISNASKMCLPQILQNKRNVFHSEYVHLIFLFYKDFQFLFRLL